MNEFMAVIQFSSPFSMEFTSLIPEQRIHINRLMEQGIITSYSLSADRRTLWMTLLASSTGEAEKVLGKMPLFRFMRYEIAELMFHNIPVFAPMKFSLN
jgi:hypothetical protein